MLRRSTASSESESSGDSDGESGGGRAKGAKKARKGKKPKKDKDAPKRGQSAYFLWMNAVGRGQVKAAEPGIEHLEISRRCGALWKDFPPEAKAEWEEKARADKARYDREMAEYNAK